MRLRSSGGERRRLSPHHKGETMTDKRRKLAQEVLTKLGDIHSTAEAPYFGYLHLQAKPYSTGRPARQSHAEYEKVVEQLIVGSLDGEYGYEVLREWSPKVRVKDWMMSLEVNEEITPERKLIFGDWAQGIMRLDFQEDK